MSFAITSVLENLRERERARVCVSVYVSACERGFGIKSGKCRQPDWTILEILHFRFLMGYIDEKKQCKSQFHMASTNISPWFRFLEKLRRNEIPSIIKHAQTCTGLLEMALIILMVWPLARGSTGKLQLIYQAYMIYPHWKINGEPAN